MPNEIDYLNALDPMGNNPFTSPGQVAAQSNLTKLTNPYGFAANTHYGEANANGVHPLTQAGYNQLAQTGGMGIVDNSQLVGTLGADSAGQAKQMQESGADAAKASFRRGRLGGLFDAAKDLAKDMVVGKGNHATEAQIHAGVNAQGSGSDPAFSMIGAGNGVGSKFDPTAGYMDKAKAYVMKDVNRLIGQPSPYNTQ